MNPLLPAQLRDDVPPWAQTVFAFLAEKERRSGSRRTVEGYARMLWPFLSSVGSPDQVTPAHVLAWAHGIGASGREPRLDADERIARKPLERPRLTANEIGEYARSLPRLWEESGAVGRQALVVAVFARLDVLGFKQLEYELTPDANRPRSGRRPAACDGAERQSC